MMKRFRIQLTPAAADYDSPDEIEPGPNGLAIAGIWVEVEAEDRGMADRIIVDLLKEGFQDSPHVELEPVRRRPEDKPPSEASHDESMY